MARCTACATELPELAVFCPRCSQPNEPDFDRLLSRRLGGRYQIYRRLGEGGLSTVFVAADTQADAIVVVKVSDPRLLVQFASGSHAEARETRDYWAEMIERMRHEVEALADLKHPNIVRVLATGAITDELRYVVMEFLRGRTLREELTARRQLDFTEAAHIGAEVATGLGAVHSRGIVHRDLTPRNIFLCDEGQESEIGSRKSKVESWERQHSLTCTSQSLNSAARSVKVIDFGIAKFPQPPGAPPYTQHAVMCGTPGYASPEQCQNLPLDHRADIYSLGVVLYELVTGQRPFAGRAATEIAFKQMQDTPVRPRDLAPDLPLRFEALILRALARDPQARQQSAEELAEELRSVATRIVVPLSEPIVPVSAPAAAAEPIRPIVVPLSESAAVLAPAPEGNGHFVEDRLAVGAETEPVAAEPEIFSAQAEQLKTVRQRRRRTALAAAAVVALLVAAGLLLARPWDNWSGQPEQFAVQASPSPADTPPSALGLDIGNQPTANPGATDAAPNVTASLLPNKLQPVVSAPKMIDSKPVESSRSKAPGSAKSQATHSAPSRERSLAVKAAQGRTSVAHPPRVNTPPSQPVPTPTITARLPQPAAQPDASSAPRPTPHPTPQVATNPRRNDTWPDERRDNSDWRRGSEQDSGAYTPRAPHPTPDAEAEIGPKLYSWRGEVSRERQVTIEMPGQPGTIQIPRDYRKRVGVVEPPSPSNGWRRAVLRVFGDGLVSIIVRWYPNRRGPDPRYQWARRGSNTD